MSGQSRPSAGVGSTSQPPNTTSGNSLSRTKEGEANKAEYSCMFCKKRKVKCDRTLPGCSICQRTQHVCIYPLNAGKPGPKLGTVRRKRPRTDSFVEQNGKLSTQELPTATQAVPRATNSKEPTRESILPSHEEPGHNDRDSSGEDSTDDQDNTSYPLTPATTPLDVRTLAYIMHPSHDDTATTHASDGESTPPIGTLGNGSLIAQACTRLGIATQSLEPCLNLYFDNMTAFSLFHQPSFMGTLRSGTSLSQLIALLASILAFSARYGLIRDESTSPSGSDSLEDGLEASFPPSHFERLSRQYVDEALEEYEDEAPPLIILQALVLLTFQQIIKGARGSAWRRLGVCVRIAYELDLHHVDRYHISERCDPQKWCRIEEKRRIWWAIWEMDVFASTIKRCPTAIDLTDNETCLPVAEDDWFESTIKPSCFLEMKPMDRLRALQECGTQSPKAWFIVLYSFMRDGHYLSKFRSPRPGRSEPGRSWRPSRFSSKDNAEELAILANALRCFGMALPRHLVHNGGCLSFSSSDPVAVVRFRRIESARYGIHVTIQLTRMMINHQDAYQGAQIDLQLSEVTISQSQAPSPARSHEALSLDLGPHREGLQQFIEAADELLRIVSWSSDDQVRYVHPFLASTIWYGAVVHLGLKFLAPLSTNIDWVESKFVVMHMILGKFAEFWDLPRALQDNLASIEETLRLFNKPGDSRLVQPSRRPAKARSTSENAASLRSSGGSTLIPPRPKRTMSSVLLHGSQPSLPTEKEKKNRLNSVTSEEDTCIVNNVQVTNSANNVHNNSTQSGSGDWFEQPITPGLESRLIACDVQLNDEQFMFSTSSFDTSGMTAFNLNLLNDAPLAQGVTNLGQPGLWDDLHWDPSAATDAGSIFQHIMNY